MTDRELLDRKGHEVNDDLPPLPEPDGTAEVNKEPYLDGYSCEYAPAWSEPLVRAYARAAVLAERERWAKECDKIGERHRKMNDSRPPELMTSGENAAYECADAIRKGTP